MEYVTSEGIVVTNRVFVGSIPDWMNENKLQLVFQDLNLDVQDTRIVVDMKTGKRKGYGFVTFYNQKDAAKVVEKGMVHTKEGVRLKVDVAIRKKGLQLRLEKQMKEQFPANVNMPVVESCVIPAQNTQAQMSFVYPTAYPHDLGYMVASRSGLPFYQPLPYQDCFWPGQGVSLPLKLYGFY